MRLKLVLGIVLAALLGSSMVASFLYTARYSLAAAAAQGGGGGVAFSLAAYGQQQQPSPPESISFESKSSDVSRPSSGNASSLLPQVYRVINSSGMHHGCTGHMSSSHSAAPKPLSKKRVQGRDGVDHSHVGLVRDPIDGMHHAWDPQDPNKCFGAFANASCAQESSIEWVRKNLLLSIITGSEGAFRVEVSQCTWLSHFPHENVFVFSDLVSEPHKSRTPHEWVCGKLPHSVYEKDGDIFSPHVPKGYVREVRKAGQGYSAAWIVAQFRFTQALEHMDAVNRARMGRGRGDGGGYKWFMIADDDTIVNIDGLAGRLQQLDHAAVPWYLSRKGWGGGGHIFSSAALAAMMKVLPGCVESYFIKGFRASDAMLLKCAGRAKLHTQLEETMTHCPASHLGAHGLLSPRQITFHGKKDFYPPVLLTTWRVSLYYLASYCKNTKAAELAVYYSACAFGSCKQHGCTKEKNAAMIDRWHQVSKNNSVTVLPFAEEGILV